MNKKIRFGISQKFVLVLMTVALVPLVSIWFLSYQSNTRLTVAKVNQELNDINRNLITHVEGWVDMNQRMLLQNADLADMKSMNGQMQNPILMSIENIYDWAYLVFTIDAAGNNIGRSDGKKLKYYGDRDYFKQILDKNIFGRQILIGKTSGQPAMVLSTGIFNKEKDLIGVLAQAMTLSALSEKIVNNHIGDTGFTFLIDEKDEVIAHPNMELTRSRVNMGKNPAVKGSKVGKSTTIFKDAAGQKIVSVAQKTSQGWTMISQQDYDEAYQLIAEENQKALFLLIGTLVLVSLIAFFVSRWLTAPLRDLTAITEKFSQGQLNLKISGTTRKDEIGQLSNAVQRLGTSIRMAMSRLQRK